MPVGPRPFAAAPFRVGLLLALVAIAAMLPLLLGPARTNDSHWINLVWADQFASRMRDGVLWPRWLPQSHDGLGAPVFFFYGPVAFWLAGIFAIIGAGVWMSLALAATAALAASGVAMWAYLRARARWPLAGALAYMLAPYHLLDFGQRGALAEFVAYAWLPLLAAGVASAADRRPALLACAYAGLILTHLPTSVLASVFLIPGLGWLEGRRAIDRWRGIAIGLVAGIGLAGAYLVPALALQSVTAMETMRSLAVYRPATWSILKLSVHDAPGVLLIHAIALATAPLALATLSRDRRALWGWFVLATALLALGACPPLWRLPPLDHVQFPWRVLVLSEFGLALLVARGRPATAWALLPSACLSLLVASPAHLPQPTIAVADLLRRHPDVIEYLPLGVGEPMAIYSPWALHLARTTPAERFDGRATTVRRFAFPSWQVRCDDGLVPSAPAAGSGLIRYSRAGCAIERRITWPERIGWTVTLLTASALVLAAFHRPRLRGHPAIGLASV